MGVVDLVGRMGSFTGTCLFRREEGTGGAYHGGRQR